jgi:hypothetical protein
LSKQFAVAVSVSVRLTFYGRSASQRTLNYQSVSHH